MAAGADVPGMPAIPRTRELAEREFHRIMSNAAQIQRMMGLYLIRAGTSTDPVRQAEAMNGAIGLAERQLAEFRRARDALTVASPGFSLPAPPPPSAPGAPRPTVTGGKRPTPRAI